MRAKHIPADQAPVIRAYGDQFHIHLGTPHTGGAFTMFTDITPPGGGPPPHFHTTEDEWWFVLEGQAEFFEGETWTAVAPGGAVFMPKNTLHTFRNVGDTPLKNLIVSSPSGIEDFFRKSEAAFQSGEEPDVKQLIAIGEEYHILFYTMAPELAACRGVPERPPVIVQPGQGRVLRAFGEEVTVLLSSEQTGGAFTMFTEVTPPGGGPPPHWHANEDEWFFVLDGTVSFFVEGAWIEAHAGDTVLAPRGQVHAFKNNTPTPTQMLIHTSPSGFEAFFTEAAQEFAKPGGPDMQRAVQIAEAHGIHFVEP